MEDDLEPYVLEWALSPRLRWSCRSHMPCGFEKAGRFPGSPAAGFCARGSFAEGRCRSRSGASWSLHQCRRARCNRREWHQVCHRYVFGGGLSRCFSRFGFTDEGHQLSRSHCSAFRPGVSVLLPAPQEVLQAAKDWILGASEDSGLAFYSAEGFLEAEEGELPGQFPLATPPSRKAKESHKASCHAYWRRCSWRKSKASHHGITGSVFGSAFGCGPSAVIAGSRPYQRSSSYWKAGLLRPQGQGLLACRSHYLRAWCLQPVALKMWLRCLQLRPQERRSLDFLVCQRRRATKPWSLGACSFGGGGRAHATAPEGDLARAVLAQSQALTALLWQMAQSSEDPMMDLGATASSATRGALGRAKLQAELASHSGSFFMSVLRALARRMQPATSTTGSAEDLLRRGVSGTMYMERFGGFGRHRDLGLILFPSDGGDGLDAGREPRGGEGRPGPIGRLHRPGCVMDGRRFDLAALLTLQEDPLSSIYINHQQSSLSRARAFSPLGGPEMGDGGFSFCKGARCDPVKTPGVDRSRAWKLKAPAFRSRRQVKACAQEERKRRRESSLKWPVAIKLRKGRRSSRCTPCQEPEHACRFIPRGARAKPSARHYEFRHLGHWLATVDFAVEV